LPPGLVHAGVEILQQAADIGRLPRIKIGGTGVRDAIALILISIEEVQGNERIQEVAHAASGEPQSVD
jgi:thiamine monophosphate synthase